MADDKVTLGPILEVLDGLPPDMILDHGGMKLSVGYLTALIKESDDMIERQYALGYTADSRVTISELTSTGLRLHPPAYVQVIDEAPAMTTHPTPPHRPEGTTMKTTIRTIRMTPVNVALEHENSLGHRVWRWQADLRDPANGNAWEILMDWGYPQRISPDDFGRLVLKAAREGVALIFAPIPSV